MTTINNLSATNTVAAGDLVPVYTQNNGDARKAAMSVLQTYMQNNLSFGVAAYTTQYSAPSSTGFSVQITDSSVDTHLILTPTGGFATGTIVLPLSTNAVDKQSILVNCTQAVTTLTVNGNGATVTGEPTALVANDFFTLKYDAPTTTWYRVG